MDGRAVTLTGSGSTDPDGTIAGYSWEFGDGQSATGRRRATPTLPTAPTPSG
ncbi:PKD domain-containing protein [Tessaracoccus sp. HDW20]|nr:PKD domain-containing protein [Tessaracoccus coleopterorum]